MQVLFEMMKFISSQQRSECYVVIPLLPRARGAEYYLSLTPRACRLRERSVVILNEVRAAVEKSTAARRDEGKQEGARGR
jgi:hypothetical protein